MQYYYNNKPVQHYLGDRIKGGAKFSMIRLAGEATARSVPFSELTTDATVDEYIKADREFYDAGNWPFFGPGGIVLSFNSLSALAKQTVRQVRIEEETKKAQLTDDSYSPALSKFCADLIDLLFSEAERDGVGNVDTILEKAKAEMEQLAEYRRANEAKINTEFDKLEEAGKKMQGDQLWDAKNQSGGYSYLEWMKREGWDINLVHTKQGAKIKEYNEWLQQQVEYLTPQLTESVFMSNKDMDQSFANPLSDKVYEDGSARTPARIDFLKDLDLITQQVFDMLSEKNLKYGDSALNPSGIFAKCDPIELINVRIDDKLARIKNNLTDDDEDPEWDLIGYLFLKRIAKMRMSCNK